MKNPFESGHIKNYILLYVSVVVIMVLFFIATSLFHDVDKVEKKVFSTEISTKSENTKDEVVEEQEVSTLKSRLKLMDKSY